MMVDLTDLIEQFRNHGCSFCNYDASPLCDALEKLQAENEQMAQLLNLTKSKAGHRSLSEAYICQLVARIEKLEAVVEAAKNDMLGAKANCGKFPESDRVSYCSAWIERGLRCSDCPVEVWLSSTSEALAALEGDDD